MKILINDLILLLNASLLCNSHRLADADYLIQSNVTHNLSYRCRGTGHDTAPRGTPITVTRSPALLMCPVSLSLTLETPRLTSVRPLSDSVK